MGLFKSDTVQISHDISLVYSPNSGSQIIELVNNNPNQIRNKFGLGNVAGVANGLLDELRCYASISSLPEIELPAITAEDSESEKLVKAQSFEWGTARFELAVFKKAKSQNDWAEFGVSALKNSGGFRYRIHRLLDLTTDNIGARIGEWGKIGVAIRSVGYGFPAAFDRITFTGHWVQEFTWVQEHPTYVIVNSYGGSGTAPPTDPEPVLEPVFTLSLAEGQTSAIANNNDSIILSIENIAAGNGVSGSWLKDGVDINVSESISTTSNNIHLLSSGKLASSGIGNYSLKLIYGEQEYITNTIAVTLSPQVSLAIASTQSGDTSFFVVDGQTYEFAIQGAYFAPGTIDFSWLRNGTPATQTTSPGVTVPITGTVTAGDNGSFTLNRSTSKGTFTSAYDSTDKSGLYKLRFTQGSVSVDSDVIYGQNKPGSVGANPTTASITTASTITVNIAGFAVGDGLTVTWLKDGVEITASQHTYANNTGNSFNGYYYSFTVSSTMFASTPFSGAGTYRLRVIKNNTPVSFLSGSLVIS